MTDATRPRGARQAPSARLAQTTNSSARVVAVIDALARCSPDGVGVRELAAELEVSRSATHRILQHLAELHVARALPNGSYAPGALLVAWSAFLADRHSLLAAARDVLEDLVAATGETTYLFSYLAGDDFATTVTGEHSDKPVRYVLEPGSTAPLDAGAAGKAILAHVPPDVLVAIEARSGSKRALHRELAEIRESGYAATVGERIPEAAGVAAPYFSDEGVAGSITITIPRYRFESASVPALGEAVSGAADKLTRLMSPNGFPPDPTTTDHP